MFTDKEMQNISSLLSQRMENVTQYTLDKIAKRINKIGGISPSSAHEIAKLKNIGADLDEITKYLATATNMNVRDIENIYKTFAKDSYDFTKPYYDATGTTMLSFEDNKALQDIIKAQSKLTQNSFRNISNSTVFALKDKDGNVIYKDIKTAYQDIVDEGITAIQSGTEDYQSRMRNIMKQYADSGVRTVDYESGLSRDIYSATRMNVLDGVRQINNQVRQQAGTEFGADGYEISVHGLCAPDHLDIQGQQFTVEQYEKLNEELDRPIGLMNCQHSIFPIVVGVSQPVYSNEELEQIKQENQANSVIVDGKKYTKYEASQIQRRLENQIRKTKREMLTAKNMGDTVGENTYKNKLRQLTNKYTQVSADAGLSKKSNRLIAYGDGNKVQVSKYNGDTVKKIYDIDKPKRPKRSDFDTDADNGYEKWQEAREKYKAQKTEYDAKLEDTVNSYIDKPRDITTYDDFSKWASENGISISQNVKDVDIKALADYAEETDKLLTKYPVVKRQFRDNFGVNYAPSEISFVAEAHSDFGGGFTFGGGFSDYKYQVTTYLDNTIDGDFVKGDGTFRNLYRHEFGHNVDSAIRTSLMEKYHQLDDDVFREQWRNAKTIEELQAGKKAVEDADKIYVQKRNEYNDDLMKCFGKNGMSEYAKTNELELFAEGFAEYEGNPNSEFGKAFGEFLNKWLKEVE